MVKNKNLAVFLAAAVLSAVIRIVQILALTEYETGFIRPERSVIFYILSAIIVLLIAFTAFYALLNTPRAKGGNSFYLVTSISSLLVGSALISDAFSVRYVGIPTVIRTLYTVFAFLSAVYFIAFALRAAVHFPLSPKFAALPVAFFVLKAAAVFIRGSYHAVISDTVLEVGIYCFNMLFFLETARAVNGLGNDKSIKKIAVFGIAAALFSFIYSVPRLIIAVFYGTALHDGAAGSVLPLFMGLYIACIVFSRVEFNAPTNRRLGIYYAGKH